MTDLRWDLAEEPKPQASLFEESIFEREPGRGEFRGIEFLHVKAQRIVNEVRNAPFGFRYTINAYRGCSHACTYCLVGETPILMADGRTKPIADIREGDAIYGTVPGDRHRQYTFGRVLAHWSTVKPAYRVVLEDGTTLITSGDHRFLSDRGWKHVTGADQGQGRRPHLTTNNSLVGVGQFTAEPKHTGDYRRGYLSGVIRRHGHLGSYTYESQGRGPATVHTFQIALVDHEALERTKRFLGAEGINTDEILVEAPTDRRQTVWAIRTRNRDGVALMRRLTAWPVGPSDDWRRGFLAGIFDAEGSYVRGTVRISNHDDQVVDQVTACLARFGFPHVAETRGATNPVHTVRVPGGLREHLRFFHTVDPAITRKRSFDQQAVKSSAPLRVVAIEPLGIDLPMYDITTTTGDFIADGVVSHNCFARPTHEYLGLDAGEDFERKIVVKVNAVPLLRAELAPRRWAGDLIAMGTNTDPYQRCEGKYRLTRDIVQVLSERQNPFSILTKSTLVLRDVDLLAEAARRTDVRVNLSIGTLDEEVWRATEPGTPHPLRRVRAVEALNRAGVPCGVLVAPVLPGLSDDPEQLDAVVKACVEAGARSISTTLLHLRPGVKDVFLPHLRRTHPEVADRYERRYRNRAYAARADQQALQGQVADLVREHGGIPADRRDPRHHTGTDPQDRSSRTRSRNPRPPTPPPPDPAAQLTLL